MMLGFCCSAATAVAEANIATGKLIFFIILINFKAPIPQRGSLLFSLKRDPPWGDGSISFIYREFDEFIQLYIVDYHVVERALKERYLIGQSVRAVIFADIRGMRSVGPTSKVFRCRTYSAPLITHLPNNSPYGLPC